MSNRIPIEESSGNVFKDLGFSDEEAEEELLKAQLGAEIFRILEERHLTQTEAASLLDVKQPEISRLKHGKFSYYSVERLLRFHALIRECHSGGERAACEDAPLGGERLASPRQQNRNAHPLAP